MTTVTRRIAARSISRSVRERLCDGGSLAKVLAVFDHACDLVTRDGHVLALVAPHIGDGPLNIVVSGEAGLFSDVRPGAPATLQNECLRVGELKIDLREAEVWEPRPDWETLRARRDTVAARLPLVHALCLCHASSSVFLALLDAPLPHDAQSKAILAAAQKATGALREGWGGDVERLQAGGRGLAGLGGGLTPAGDDFLLGVTIWAWLAHPTPAFLCRVLVEAAAPHTSTLSAAFLQAAALGEYSASWHDLLGVLSDGAEDKIATAVHGVLAHGATSGADSLSGFLCPSTKF